jgi:hypothetical protein
MTQIARNVQFSKLFPEAIFGAKNLKKLLSSYLMDIYAQKKKMKTIEDLRAQGTE